MSPYPKKLIEVSIPLKEINEACARERSIRYGHTAKKLGKIAGVDAFILGTLISEENSFSVRVKIVDIGTATIGGAARASFDSTPTLANLYQQMPIQESSWEPFEASEDTNRLHTRRRTSRFVGGRFRHTQAAPSISCKRQPEHRWAVTG